MLRVVAEHDARQEFALTLDEICRRGAERMLTVVLEAEVDACVERHQDVRDDAGHALVVRNGHARPRTVVAGAGAIGVRAPRVDDRRTDPATSERLRFQSSIVPSTPEPCRGQGLRRGTTVSVQQAPGHHVWSP